ncbi:hypothetical protein [Sorangium sp. So ce1151]
MEEDDVEPSRPAQHTPGSRASPAGEARAPPSSPAALGAGDAAAPGG